MEFHLLHILVFLAVALVASGDATLPPELYWNSVLPNTPMPKSIRNLLQPDLVGEKGYAVSVKGKGRRVFVGVPGYGPFSYVYAATETQLHDDPTVALFFLEKDMHPGKSMTLRFTQQNPDDANSATFLSRKVAQSIPFSSRELPKILRIFSVKPGSLEAQVMAETIEECESPGIVGEEKYCATSLESMVDFSVAKLGRNVKLASTEVSKEETQLQKYTITASGVKKFGGGRDHKSVVCHKEKYVYAVFYCHATVSSRAYVVSMEGSDGAEVKAVAVCHTDTAAWNPKHLAFQVLKVKPGTVPVCHFLPQDHVVWVPNN